MEPVGQPGSAVHIEVPADGVRAVFLQRLERIHRVALGLAHLLAVLILHVSQDNYVLVRRLVEDQGGDSQQRVEPSSGLVHRLGDEVRRELLLEKILIFKWIVKLGKGHGSRVEPAVDHLRHPVHFFSALGTLDGHAVDIGTVELDVIRAVVGQFL